MITVITGLFGGGLELLEPDVAPGDVQLVAFTDDPAIQSARWTVNTVPRDPRTTPRRQAKRYKILPHESFPRSDYTLWIDSTLTLTIDPRDLVERYLSDADLALFSHPWRDCIYDEAETCIADGYDAPERIRRQMERYRREEYPARNGLAACGILLRRHTPAIRALNEAWWAEIVRGSVRDQLSFNYVCWRLGVGYRTFAGTCFENAYFRYRPHSAAAESDRSPPEGKAEESLGGSDS